MKIFSNILVDLLKLLHDNKQSEFDLIAFKTRIGYSTVDKISFNIRERIFSLLKESDMIEEKEIVIYSNLIKKMADSDFLNQIDVAHIRFRLEKENKMDDETIAMIFRINK